MLSSAVGLLYFFRTALVLMLFKVIQNFFLLFDLTTVVLCFFIGNLDFELIVIKLFLLPFDLNTKLNILLF